MTTVTEINTTQIYQVFIRATPEQIWEAITKPEFTEKYFYGTRAEYDLRPGGSYRSLSAESDDRGRGSGGGRAAEARADMALPL